MDRQRKKRYLVMYGERKICETWATTPKRAVANAFWRYFKEGDKYRYVDVSVNDLDAVEIG